MTDRVYAAHPSDRTARAEAEHASAATLTGEYEHILDVVHDRQGTGAAFGALLRLCSTALARVALLEQQFGTGGGFVGGRSDRPRAARRSDRRSRARARDEQQAQSRLYPRSNVIALPVRDRDASS